MLDSTIERIGTVLEASKAQKTLAKQIVLCENPDLEPTKQSQMRYKDGTQEQSYGLVQIHLPAHPNITYAQAVEPEFAIGFLLEEIKDGHAGIWSCYHIVTGK